MELWQYYRMLRKRKWLIIIGTLICTILAGGYVWLTPSMYVATATVMEKMPDASNVVLFNSPVFQIDARTRLSNLMNMALSHSVSADAMNMMENQRGMKVSNPKEIIRTLDIEPVQDSTIVSISIKAADPHDATNGADCVVQALKDKYNSINYGSALSTRKFIEDQLPAAKAKLRKRQNELQKYKEGSNSASLTNQTAALIQQITQVESNLATYQVQLHEAQAKVRALRSQLKRFPQNRLTAVTVQSNPVWQQLQMEYAKQQIELQKMLLDRTPDHPEVKALSEQLEETHRKLGEQAETITGSQTKATNPLADNLSQNYVSALTESATSAAAVRAAHNVLAEMRPQLKSLPAREAMIARLTIEEENARSTYTNLKQKYDEAALKEKEAGNVSTLQVVDNAAVDYPSDWTRKVFKTFLFFLFGLIFTSGMAFLLNYMDNSVKTPRDAQDLLKLPVFSVVPTAKIHSLADKKALPAIGTSYEMLTATLWAKSSEMGEHVFLVASAEPNVGRSVTAANIAISLASEGAKVILVDADFRQPSLHKIFGLRNERGLSNVLVGQLALKDAITSTSVSDLQLLASGPQPSNPIRMLRSHEMTQVMHELYGMADFVIFDSPAGVTFADSTLLASMIKNVIIVHAAGSVPRGLEEEFRRRLEDVGANMIGAVLNMVRVEDSHSSYHFRSAYSDALRHDKQLALRELTGVVSSDISDDDANSRI